MTGETLSSQPVYTMNTTPILYGAFEAICIDIVDVNRGFIQVSDSRTNSVQSLEIPQRELDPFVCCRDSGVLDFWNDPNEDIYNSEDGHLL